MKTYNQMFNELVNDAKFFSAKHLEGISYEHLESLYSELSPAAFEERARLLKPHWDAVAKAQKTA